MMHVTKWDPVVIVQKMWKRNVEWCGFDTCLDIEIENIIYGFYKLPDHNIQNVSLFGLIKSNLCKGADSGKRKTENES